MQIGPGPSPLWQPGVCPAAKTSLAWAVHKIKSVCFTVWFVPLKSPESDIKAWHSLRSLCCQRVVWCCCKGLRVGQSRVSSLPCQKRGQWVAPVAVFCHCARRWGAAGLEGAEQPGTTPPYPPSAPYSVPRWLCTLGQSKSGPGLWQKHQTIPFAVISGVGVCLLLQ